MSDAITLDTVRVFESDAAVLQFPVTARLTSFGLRPGAMSIRSSGTEHWPMVPVSAGEEPAQSATLWVFLRIDGQWCATGAERLRPTQTNGDKPEGEVSTLVGSDWLYDPNRWRQMAGYNPKPGERVGVMVVAGSTRSDNNTPVRERSNLLLIEWPDARGANPCRVVWDEMAPTAPPGTSPTSVDVPAAGSDGSVAAGTVASSLPALDVAARLEALERAVKALELEQQAIRAALSAPPPK